MEYEGKGVGSKTGLFSGNIVTLVSRVYEPDVDEEAGGRELAGVDVRDRASRWDSERGVECSIVYRGIFFYYAAWIGIGGCGELCCVSGTG